MESVHNEPQSRHLKNRLWLAIMLGSLAAFGSLTVDMYLPSFPAIAESFQTDASHVQLSLTAALLGLAGGQLIIGPISDARGRKKPLVFFLFLFIIASLLCFIAPSIWVFIFARCMQGFSASASVVIARAIARDLYSGTSLTQFFSMLMVMTGLSPILAPIIGSTILEAVGWRSVFAVLAFIAVLMVVIICVTFEESLPRSRRTKNNLRQTVHTFGDLVKERMFIGIALAQGFIMAGAFAFVAGSPFLYQTLYGVSPSAYSLLIALNGIGIIIGNQLAGRLATILPERTLLFYGLILSSFTSFLLIMMFLFNAPLVFVVLPVFIMLMCVGVANTTCFSLAMETQGHRAGSAAALMGLLPYLFGATVSPIVGLLVETNAWPMGVIMSSTTLIALAIFLMSGNRLKQK